VLTTLLTILQMPEGGRRILFSLIVLFVTAALFEDQATARLGCFRDPLLDGRTIGS
jgi:hypothetical protein